MTASQIGIAAQRPYFAEDRSVVYAGDCRTLLPFIAGESVDLVLTDPPYGVEYEGRWNNSREPIVGDQEPALLMPAFAEMWRILKADSFCLSFYGWPHADVFLEGWKHIGFRPVSHIVCVKNNVGLGYFTRSQHETAFLLAKGNPHKRQPAHSDVFAWERE